MRHGSAITFGKFAPFARTPSPSSSTFPPSVFRRLHAKGGDTCGLADGGTRPAWCRSRRSICLLEACLTQRKAVSDKARSQHACRRVVRRCLAAAHGPLLYDTE